MTPKIHAIVIGASAGAIEALSVVLGTLPHDYPLPILIVIHLPPHRDNAIVDLFRAKCALNVCEAADKEPIQKGTIYFAPPDYHLMVEAELCFSLSSEEPVLYSRPSVDVLFETAAEAYGANLVGVILTGASSDGARGLKCIYDGGGVAIVQRPDSALAAVMPQSALEGCPAAVVMSLDQIANYLKEVGKSE